MVKKKKVELGIAIQKKIYRLDKKFLQQRAMRDKAFLKKRGLLIKKIK